MFAMREQRRQRNLVLLAAAATLALLALIGAAVALTPKPILTLDDAVAAVLSRKGIAYKHVTTSRAHPSTGIYFAYAFDVCVQLDGGAQAVGELNCEPSQSACFVDIQHLGVHYERLPALEHDQRWDWLAWAQGLVGKVLPR